MGLIRLPHLVEPNSFEKWGCFPQSMLLLGHMRDAKASQR